MPSVAIITTSLASRPPTRQALESLSAENAISEIIVPEGVDFSRSTATAPSKIKSLPQMEANLNCVSWRNTAATKVKSEFIAFCDLSTVFKTKLWQSISEESAYDKYACFERRTDVPVFGLRNFLLINRVLFLDCGGFDDLFVFDENTATDEFISRADLLKLKCHELSWNLVAQIDPGSPGEDQNQASNRKYFVRKIQYMALSLRATVSKTERQILRAQIDDQNSKIDSAKRK